MLVLLALFRESFVCEPTTTIHVEFNRPSLHLLLHFRYVEFRLLHALSSSNSGGELSGSDANVS